MNEEEKQPFTDHLDELRKRLIVCFAHGRAGWLALEDLLDLVDAAARPIQFVAQQLVGRAGRGAEAAVHAGAQDPVRLAAAGRISNEIGERCLHGVAAC